METNLKTRSLGLYWTTFGRVERELFIAGGSVLVIKISVL